MGLILNLSFFKKLIYCFFFNICSINGHVHCIQNKDNQAERVGASVPVYLAEILKYLLSEVLELTGNAIRDNKKTYIIPEYLQLIVHNDKELNKLLDGVTIAQVNVLLNTLKYKWQIFLSNKRVNYVKRS